MNPAFGSPTGAQSPPSFPAQLRPCCGPPEPPRVSHTTHGFQYLTEGRFDQVGPHELKDERRRVVLTRERGKFQDAGVKYGSQDTAWLDAMPASAAWFRQTRPLPRR